MTGRLTNYKGKTKQTKNVSLYQLFRPLMSCSDIHLDMSSTYVYVEHVVLLQSRTEREEQRSKCWQCLKVSTMARNWLAVHMAQADETQVLTQVSKKVNFSSFSPFSFHPLYTLNLGENMFLLLHLIVAILLSDVSEKEGENSRNQEHIWSVVPLGILFFLTPVDEKLKPQGNVLFLKFSKKGN